MKRSTKNIIIRLSALLFVLAFISLSFVTKAKVNDFKVKEIKIIIDELEDNFMLTKDDVYYLVTKNYSLGTQNINTIILNNIENTVDKIPCVESTSAYIDKDKNLCVEVKQRTPIARVYNSYNENFYIDKYGIKFKPKQPQVIKVPIISGVINEAADFDTIRSANLKDAFDLCIYLSEKPIWKNIIGQISINQDNNLELVPRLGNSLILLGKSEDLDEKFKKLDVFYTEVLERVGWEKYRVINIMYKDQAICLK